MSTPPEFRDAFDLIAAAADKAGKLKHAERPSDPLEIIAESPKREVTAIVVDGVVRSIRLDDRTLEDLTTQELEDLITRTINDALSQWGEESLKQMQNATPELTEVTAAIAEARARVHSGFSEIIERSRRM